MASGTSPTLALILTTVFAFGCRKNPDPHYIDAAKFDSPKQLADTLQYLVGMREETVSEAMQRNGFGCGERSPITVDRKADTLAAGKPYLACWHKHRVNFGLRHRTWMVEFALDSGYVRSVGASAIYQDLG
ncbi:MAG TPA: hypothetical protein VJS39_13205 [Gemmatimonadaceae bacterium]|nr:hypothetical protein [Gemmatimonadaceae bacterium]